MTQSDLDPLWALATFPAVLLSAELALRLGFPSALGRVAGAARGALHLMRESDANDPGAEAALLRLAGRLLAGSLGLALRLLGVLAVYGGTFLACMALAGDRGEAAWAGLMHWGVHLIALAIAVPFLLVRSRVAGRA